jgi:peptidoglycan pentaglycine glycine transferase (the first glycine)
MEKSFLQSKEWLDFQKSLGRKIWQVGEINIIKYNLPFGKSYLYSPRLRPSDFGGQARFGGFLAEIKKIAKKENAIFFKIEPEEEIDLGKFGFIKAHDIQPKKTLILDITKSEQELLGKMHSKTRYNIQLAAKKGVIVRNSKFEEADFEEFWELMRETTKRDGFYAHPKEYYRKLLKIPGVELFVAVIPPSAGWAMPKIIAANIIVFYSQRAIYLHGASDYKHRNLMAASLLQWEQIKEAKRRGCAEYDFWGIDEIKWPGVTRFKKSFNGREVEYSGAYNLVLQLTWYFIYKIARKIL